MFCKYCGAQMEENNPICPACGKDTSAEPEVQQAPVNMAAAPEVQESHNPWKIVAAVAVGVAVLAVLVAVVIGGMMGKVNDQLSGVNQTEPSSVPTQSVPSEGTPAAETIPADGDPDNETAKGSYTVSDAEASAQNNVVVATMGDRELTNGQLQVYYWMQFYDFLDYYGDYAAYYGLDYTKPLDTQACPANGGTWQQYFLSIALKNWQNYQALSLEADNAGFELDEDSAAALANLEADLGEQAVSGGYADALALVQADMGKGVTVEDYRHYMELYYKGFLYFSGVVDQFNPTDAEVEAYFAEHEAEYAENGLTKETKFVDVRHILLMPEGGTKDANGNTVYSEAEWEACRANAEGVLDAYLAGEKTEDEFAKLAGIHSTDPGSKDNGGLYTDVYVGQMVEPFNDWCFDDVRQVGDTGLVKTSYGYHVMYFVGSRTPWFDYVKSDLAAEMGTEMVHNVQDRHPITVDYSKIVLTAIDFS